MIRSNRDQIFISQNNTDEMRLTKSQLEVLHILWASDTPLSAQGIAEKLRYQIGSSLIVSIAIENLLAEDAICTSIWDLKQVYNSGFYREERRMFITVPTPDGATADAMVQPIVFGSHPRRLRFSAAI